SLSSHESWYVCLICYTPSPSLIACWTWIFRLDPSPQFADLDLEKSWMSLDLPQSRLRYGPTHHG
ncbi:hypothetical protein BDW66DRAFT_146563, partial [Aspergillus desertorum]